MDSAAPAKPTTTGRESRVTGNRRIALWLSAALIAVSVAALGAYWADRLANFANLEESTLVEMEHRAAVLTWAVAEQTRSVVFNADLALNHLQRAFHDSGRIGEPEARTVLAGTPPGFVRRVTVIDATGYAVFSHPQLPAGNPTFLGDRPHFVAHAKGGDDALFIGHPIQSRFTGEWLLPMTRPIRTPSGKFSGVVMLTVAPEYFARVYERLTEGREDVIALVHRDGTFLSRSRNLLDHLGKSVRSDRPFVGETGAESGVFRSFSSHEPVNRVFAFRRLAEWPVVVVAGLGVVETLAPLRESRVRDLQAASAVSVLVLLLVAGVCIVLIRLEQNLLRLSDTEERLALAFAGASELAWEWNVPHRRMTVYGDCGPLLGLETRESRIGLDEWTERIHPEDRDATGARIRQALSQDSGGVDLQYRARHADGSWRWVLVRGRVVARGDGGRAERLVGVLLDVDAAKRAELLAAQTRESYARLIESAGEGIFVVDREGCVDILNPAAERLLGWTAKEAQGRISDELFRLSPAGDGRGPGPGSPLARTLADGVARRSERVTYQHRNGRPVQVELSVAPIAVDGQTTGAVVVVTDISERLAWEAELERLARTDTLTGVSNRRAFVELVEREIYRAERAQEALSLMMLDLDHFKSINDSYGHAAGDAMLVAAAHTCVEELRRIDVFGRVGGEEFAVALPGVGLREARAVAERLRERVAALRVEHEDVTMTCTVSIGIAERHPVENFDAVLARADAALYAAKQAGRNRVADSLGVTA